MDRVETARAEARVIGWTQSLVWESLDAPAYARFTQPIVEPTEGTGWNLTGEIRVPDQSGTFVAQLYSAKVRIVCSPSRNRECWELTGLSVGDAALAAVDRDISLDQDVPAETTPAVTDPPGADENPPDQNPSGQNAGHQDAGEESAPSPVAEAEPSPPKTAVELLEARLTALTVEPSASPATEAAPDAAIPAAAGDPLDQSGYRHAGLHDFEAASTGQSSGIETAAAATATAPEGYPPIPSRKPL